MFLLVLYHDFIFLKIEWNLSADIYLYAYIKKLDSDKCLHKMYFSISDAQTRYDFNITIYKTHLQRRKTMLLVFYTN